MKNFRLFFAVLAIAGSTFLSSCSVTLPVCATSNPVGAKVGKASSTCIMGVFFLGGGDLGIKKAAKNGGITKISTVDFKRKMVFFNMVMKYETIITGE